MSPLCQSQQEKGLDILECWVVHGMAYEARGVLHKVVAGCLAAAVSPYETGGKAARNTEDAQEQKERHRFHVLGQFLEKQPFREKANLEAGCPHDLASLDDFLLRRKDILRCFDRCNRRI